MTELRVNGEPRAFAGATIADLLASLGVAADRPGIAVARNGEVVRRAHWPTTALADGDAVEVVTARGGG
ncbi:MAG: sulfur carrier protein ThiS [Alphaproteobacteria bacterium]|nr:sulfur carrier protein ThiS [Alphaproteobacteria bacterium]